MIKEDKSGKPKIYAKLYPSKNEPLQTSAFFYRLVEKNGRKGKSMILDELKLTGVPLEGTCVLKIKQLFCGTAKSITCTVDEVLVEEEIYPTSAFDEYEDVGEEEQ